MGQVCDAVDPQMLVIEGARAECAEASKEPSCTSNWVEGEDER